MSHEANDCGFVQVVKLSSFSEILYFLFYLDYEKVLELEPDNFEATNELRKIDQVNYKHLSAFGLTFV